MRHHLVILHDQYLRLMEAGRKRVECRLSSARRPPFEAVTRGDLLWLKLPSRPILAVATAGECLFRELSDGDDLRRVEEEHGDSICASPGFFEGAADWARFCSLIWIDTVVAIRPMPVQKSDMRAWVVLDQMPWPGMRIGARGRLPEVALGRDERDRGIKGQRDRGTGGPGGRGTRRPGD